MKILRIFFCWVLLIVMIGMSISKVRANEENKVNTSPDEPPQISKSIMPSPIDARKFRYQGKIYPLFGSRNNFLGESLYKITADFKRRSEMGLNSFRFWSQWQDFNAPQPWKRIPGKSGLHGSPLFDLSQLNDAYFEKAKAIVQAAQQYGIIIHWFLFEECGLESSPHRWEINPLHPQNNVNNLGLREDLGACNEHGCVYNLENKRLLQILNQYVDRLVSEIGPSGNVLFEIGNELTANYAWSYHWIKRIHNKGYLTLINSFVEEQRFLDTNELNAFAFHNIDPYKVNDLFLRYYESGKHLTYEEQVLKKPDENGLIHLIWGALLAMGSYSFDEIGEENRERAECYSSHAAFFFQDFVRHYETMVPLNRIIKEGIGYCAAAKGKEYLCLTQDNLLVLDLSTIPKGKKVKPIWYNPKTGEQQIGKSFARVMNEYRFEQKMWELAILHLGVLE